MSSFLSYQEAVAAGEERVGGKAWTLARLSAWGLPVPNGIAVERTLYRDTLAIPAIRSMVDKACALDLDAVVTDGAAHVLSNLRAAISNATFEPQIRDELDRALECAGLSDHPVAVRSSASGEDGARHAFAGIHESFLNLQGSGLIADAILKCFASLWTVQALAYRRRFGIADRDIDSAVLICAMIHAEGRNEPAVAGVTFTADPQDGRRDTFVVEAVKGLGDKLVQGHVKPETMRARLSFRGFSCDDSALLPRDVLQDLLIQCHRVHWACSDGDIPQDIEWAWDGQRIFILQARPVTSLPRRTFPDIADQPAIWTNANFKEVLSGIMSPMGWCLVPQMAAATFFDIHHIAGYREPAGMQIVRRFDGRAYVDAAMIQFSAYDAFGISPDETNRTFGGFQPEIRLPKTGAKRRGRSPSQILRLIRVMKALSRGRKTLPRLLESMQQWALARSREDLSQDSRTELLGRTLSLDEPDRQVPFMLANALGSTWLGIARTIAGKRLPAQDFDALAGGLMAARGGVVSADHAYDLQAIRARFSPGSPAYDNAIAGWTDKYGHRGFNEFDIASPRWREAPAQIEIMAEGMEAGTTNPATARAARERAEASLRLLPFLLRRVMAYAIDRAAEGFRIREQAKSCLVANVGIFRPIVLEWGARLARDKKIATPDDAFFLTFADFWAWATGRWDGDRAERLVAARKAQLATWQAEPEPADVILEKADGLEGIPHAAPRIEGRRLTGSGVSQGRARGPARKLTSPLGAAALQAGDILVARSTDPSWTPLFLRASGIVVEIGGYLSHGAIVAREFGLPAVVNSPGCFDAIPDGAELQIDGGVGSIEIATAE
jgi:phosphohistidine swiveling domain-containing protein